MDGFFVGLGISAILVFITLIIGYSFSIARKRNDIADVFWGIYFAVAVVGSFVVQGIAIDARLIPLILVIVWSLRLSHHIAKRHQNRPEDPRYVAWRTQWMDHGVRYFYLRSFAQVFLLQGLLALVVVSPAVYLMSSLIGVTGAMVPIWLWVGSVVWLGGFLFESIADRQLAAFLRVPENHGKVMQSGLWAYSRHPNYFGEILQWVGIWTMTLPGGWFTIVGPLTIYILIVYVSGIPLAEKGMQDNPDFVRYQATTSSLIPIPRMMTRFASPHTIGAMLIEFGPLLLFFVTFEFFDFFTSVMILIGAVTVAVYGSLRLYRKLSLFPILSSGSVILFGAITLITHEPFWIIFKDTLYFGIFGILILVPLVFNRLVLKHLFEQVFAITDTGWKWVSWNWAIFMILIAISNEIVRVRLSAEAWVHYKMIVLIILVVFSGIQMIIASRTRLPEASVLGLRR